MPLNNNYTIKMNDTGGRLSTTAGQTISLRNVLKAPSTGTGTGGGGATTLAELSDVSVVNRVDGAALVWEADNSRYEVKLADIDGGTF